MTTPTRLTARSVVLSVLLGAHPARATAAELVRLTADFEIREPTLRVALTRMVAAGDLIRSDDGYRLSQRLLDRQRRQDDALRPPLRDWDGRWLTAVVTSVGADARTRSELRKVLQESRFGELREGVWLRPDNLRTGPDPDIYPHVRLLHSVDDAPAELAARLWDLAGWSATATELIVAMSEARDLPTEFAVAAGMVRHLLTDPVLPGELSPPDWPGWRLRAEYARFAAELAGRRNQRLPASSSAR